MKAVKIGTRVEIYNDTVKTYNELPPKAYIVRFSKMTGFYLDEYAEIELKEEKIYGEHIQKVEKVLKAYAQFDRNLGVILSGHKGMGKSLFAKILSVEAVKQGIPLIVIDKYISGIASYIESIDQKVMVLFDEFDKTFAEIKVVEGETKPQTALLSLFDGIAQGKKLFVITCNDIAQLNEYIVNRPGRFHYHFRFDYPSEDEVRIYLRDKLDEKYYGEIDYIIDFSRKVNLNYDCLRAIVFEINNGENFSEAISDLNIINTKQERYDFTMYFKNGAPIEGRNVAIDLFNDSQIWISVAEDEYHEIINIGFYACDFEYDMVNRYAVVPAEKLNITYDEDFDKTLVERLKNLIPDYLVINKAKEKSLHYMI